MKPKTPKTALPQKARLGIVAPASPFHRKGFDRGIEVLRSMGFEPVFDMSLFERNGYLAGSDRHRAEQVNRFFADDAIDGILCARGGYGCLRMLEFLDLEMIAENSKPFVGYSDITVLLCVLSQRCGVPVFHGPNVVDLGLIDSSRMRQSLRQCLSGDFPMTLSADEPLLICPGKASGQLMGGNLTLLNHLTGTPYMPDFSKAVLFLEDRAELPYRVDRMLSQMKLSGCFDDLRGIVLGSFQDCGDMADIARVFADVFSGLSIPILGGFSLGHGDTNLTIPLQVSVQMDTDRGALLFLQERRESLSLAASESPKPGTGSILAGPHERMQQAVADGVFPGAVLMVTQGRDLRHFQAYGIADNRTGEPVERGTIFDLASLTKPLATTVCMMKLVTDGRLALDSRLDSLLPQTRQTEKAGITVEQLLLHTAGMPAHRPYFQKISGIPFGDARKALTHMVLGEPLIAMPGAETIYSDLGFMLLRSVVETVSQKRIDTFLREEVYGPLGIDHLFYIDIDTGKALHESVAATSRCPFRRRMIRGEVEDENAWVVGGIDGHAGLFGTAEAVRQLLSVLLDAYSGLVETGLFPSNLVRLFMQTDGHTQRALGFDTPSATDPSTGRFFSDRTVGHLGFTGTSFWMDLSAEVVVILLTNRVHPSRENERIREFRPIIHDAVMQSL